jgi:hypothetical protein
MDNFNQGAYDDYPGLKKGEVSTGVSWSSFRAALRFS